MCCGASVEPETARFEPGSAGLEAAALPSELSHLFIFQIYGENEMAWLNKDISVSDKTANGTKLGKP